MNRDEERRDVNSVLYLPSFRLSVFPIASGRDCE
jgi:hypothetical protein